MPAESVAPRRGRPRRTLPGVPPPSAQRNFTDPDSCIMKGVEKAFIQGYNAHAPVFGLIKRARGFRQFLLRGLAKVQAEWALMCLTQNLLTLYRRGRGCPA